MQTATPTAAAALPNKKTNLFDYCLTNKQQDYDCKYVCKYEWNSHQCSNSVQKIDQICLDTVTW
jgi:hypothetical protein